VPDLGGVVGPAQDLGEPVLGPSLPPQVPDRLERRQGLGEQAPRDLLIADVRLDAPKGEQRPGLEVLVARAPGPVPGRGGRRGRVLMPPELDEALGPPQRQADDEPGLLPGGRLGGLDGPAVQRLGQPGLVGERAVGPAAEVPGGEAGQVPVTGLDGAGAAQSPGLLVVVGQLGDGLLGQGSASSQVATWRCRADRSRRGIDS
jgi:hypothetical protein